MADVKVFQEKSSSMVQPEESGAIIKDDKRYSFISKASK